jgi:hypothetical protein
VHREIKKNLVTADVNKAAEWLDRSALPLRGATIFAANYESEGRTFESFQARQLTSSLTQEGQS